MNLAPADGATDVSLTPTLELMAMLIFPPCTWDATVWNVKEESSGTTVFSTGDDTVNLASITIPAGALQPGATYRWTALIVSFSTGPQGSRVNSNWSIFTRFTTQAGALGPPPVWPQPQVTSLNPDSGPPTTVVTVNGSGFVQAGMGGDSLVLLNGDAVNTTVVSDTQLRFTVPPNVTPGAYRVQVSNPTPFAPVLSNSVTFTVTAPVVVQFCTDLPTPVNSTPADGATGVPLTVTLEIMTVFTLFPCTWDLTGFLVAEDAGFLNVVFYDEIKGGKLTVPAGVLRPGTRYWWRAGGLSQGTGPGGVDVESNGSVPTSFTTQGTAGQACIWPGILSFSPLDGAAGISLTPTLQVTYAVLPPPHCSHDFSQWQIATDASFATLILDSGDDVINLTSITVPSGTLLAGTTYYWRVRMKSRQGEVHLWSPHHFTTQSGSGLPGNQPPIANFSFSPAAPTTGQMIQFADQSNDPDGTGDIVSRNWDFGDGATSALQNPAHTFSSAGTFMVKLTVIDRAGQMASASKPVVINPTIGPMILSIEQAVAQLVANDPAGMQAHLLIGDQEILLAIQYWITGQPVPGTVGQTISDRKMLELISLWIQAKPIAAAELLVAG